MSLSPPRKFEFLERANARLKRVVAATLLIIFALPQGFSEQVRQYAVIRLTT